MSESLVDIIWEARDEIIEAALDRGHWEEGEQERIDLLADQAHALEFDPTPPEHLKMNGVLAP